MTDETDPTRWKCKNQPSVHNEKSGEGKDKGVGKETDEKGKGGIKRKRGEINKDANHAEELRK